MSAEPPELLRICVVGNSGSGKSTFARSLAKNLHLPAVELDAIFHQPGWTQLEAEEFRSRVVQRLADAQAESGGWVVDGNYSSHLTDITLANADVVVWFDLPRRLVMWQLSRRTLSRVATKQELWNGNVERWPNLVKWSPEQNILRWAWTQHLNYRQKYEHLSREIGARWVRIRNTRERDAALAALSTESGSRRR